MGAPLHDAPERVRTCAGLAIEEGRRKRLSSSAWTGHGQPVVLIGEKYLQGRPGWFEQACLALSWNRRWRRDGSSRTFVAAPRRGNPGARRYNGLRRTHGPSPGRMRRRGTAGWCSNTLDFRVSPPALAAPGTSAHAEAATGRGRRV